MKKSSRPAALFQHHVTPKFEDVKIYFTQKRIPETEAEDFYRLYEGRQWKDKRGNLIANWKPIAYRWIQSILKQDPLLYRKSGR